MKWILQSGKGLTMRYTRAPEHDRRIRRGDEFAADAWRDNETGEIRYSAVGYDLNVDDKRNVQTAANNDRKPSKRG